MAEKKPTIDLNAPIVPVFAKEEFEQLSDKEKNYCYYISAASWAGNKCNYFQKSYEAPAMFTILQLVYSGQKYASLKENCLKNKISEEDFKKIEVYSAGFLTNCGNFRSFGDSKFVPDVDEQTFQNFIKSSQNYHSYQTLLDELWNEIKPYIMGYQDKLAKIGHDFDGGSCAYYSPTMNKDEINFVDSVLQVVNVSTLNTRIVKINESHFQVLIASSNLKTVSHYMDQKRVDLVYGDFSSFMRLVSKNLTEANKYAANHNQKLMLTKYVEHFQGGDIEVHKDSQRAWVRDKGPVIETNIGFIEAYLDPKNVRAEWEGFVACVNKEQSEKTQRFVDEAANFFDMMPWPRTFEKDSFLKPDFTSLSVITFGSSGTPLGINIPNYDDIRQVEGFKNVILGNCIPTPKVEDILFFNLEDATQKCKWFPQCIFHKVIYHELLGHGCGKLFQKTQDGFNFDPKIIDPLTGQQVQGYYNEKDTWSSIFQSLSTPYEECRADSIALYFSCFEKSFQVLQPEHAANWKEICETCFLEFIYQGIIGLQFFNKEAKKWGQAHIHGRWVILQVLLEGGNDFIKIELCKKDDKDWISVSMDRNQVLTTGMNTMKNFLLKLQVYKSTANFAKANEMFSAYSEVSEKFLKIRDIVIENRKPRKFEVQGHLYKLDNKVNYMTFPETAEGIIESYMTRYPHFDKEMYDLWKEYQPYMRPTL